MVQRLHRSVPFLEGLNRALLDNTAGVPCWHGRTLRIADSSSLSQQASHGTDWRIHGVFDFGQGRFSHLELTDSHGGEALDRGGAVAGEVRIGDRNYANAPSWRRFQAAHQAQNPAIAADFIVRMRWNTLRLVDTAGDPRARHEGRGPKRLDGGSPRQKGRPEGQGLLTSPSTAMHYSYGEHSHAEGLQTSG